ncbi:hypothetical protein [Marinobacter halophilus]|uniref:Uncharacterized protein n=1 Tax=Marinobacter halophilus TaxID=1323740 RepID=A0A2T1K885_9GAMM|nr:hypothetical protein [Marinobacter halophilus]PSF06349.1 hypothetical protein C7H08_14610 [Marinobacter halophilus]GGC71797.1 hypothetical protein GCM10011362_20400 [Marinobacter halophilus]
MIRSTLILSALLFSAPTALGSPFEFTGTATDDRDNLIYVESHRVEGHCAEGVFQPVMHSVQYRETRRDEPFAVKALSFDNGSLRPTVEFSQPDYNEQLNIRHMEPDELEIQWQQPSGNTEVYSVTFDQSLVVDAGFDHLVRANWDRVARGEAIEFRFLAPTRGEHYGFVLESTSSSQISADVVVRIRPTSLVLRLLVDPIVLGYNREGALTDYLGLTNIRRNSDENYTAHIRYQVSNYPDCELTP